MKKRLVGVFVLIACATMLGGCLRVAGQSVPKHVLAADPNDFSIAGDELALHYYGAGGWGVLWQGEYLLMAPFFSNHPFGEYGNLANQAEVEAIGAGVAGTPFSSAGLILVGHGHVDHAGDIPGYFLDVLGSDEIPDNQAGLIANQTTQNMLSDLIAKNVFRCEEVPEENGIPMTGCTLTGFRITPLISDHAPNMVINLGPFGVNGLAMSGFAGHQRVPWGAAPARPADYVSGDTWAYLIDLLDSLGNVVFRIHYMDAAAGPGNAIVPASLLAERPIDVQIACVPGYTFVADYPKNILTPDHDVGYVFLGHWEDFFRNRAKPLKPVRPAVNQTRLNDFVQDIEDTMVPDDRLLPTNKQDSDCPSSLNQCGPRGARWAMPVPGETYQFDTTP